MTNLTQYLLSYFDIFPPLCHGLNDFTSNCEVLALSLDIRKGSNPGTSVDVSFCVPLDSVPLGNGRASG